MLKWAQFFLLSLSRPRPSRIWKRRFNRNRINGPRIRISAKRITCRKTITKAETALRQAVRHDPEGLAHYQLGLVYRSLGQKEAANEQFEISRKLKLESLAHDGNQMKTMESVSQ